MAHVPHDATARLNDHHRNDLLAIARRFGGHPTCTDVEAEAVTDVGVALRVSSPSGVASVFVPFLSEPDPTGRLSKRLRFGHLASAAREANGRGGEASVWQLPAP